MIRIAGLHKSFGTLAVLRGIDLHVPANQVVCVIGPSGSGKSTLLRCMNLLEKPTSGRVTIAGDEITASHASVTKIRAEVGMVFQHFNLFPHMTVLQNITLAPIKVRKEARARRSRTGLACWSGWGSRTRRRPTRGSFPAGRSSGWRLPGTWRCSPRSCFLTNPPAHWTLRWSARSFRS